MGWALVLQYTYFKLFVESRRARGVRAILLRMLSKLCCGLGNILGLIGRERSINRESEPLHANVDLEGQETLGIVRRL